MLSCTKSRRRVVQRWPAVPIAANATPRSVRSRSAVGVTTAALLPPSSRMARAKRCASFGATARPIAVEPVAETKGTLALLTRASPISRPPINTADNPSGAEPPSALKRFRARPNSASVAKAVRVVFSDGFQTMLLALGGDRQAEELPGKSHGVVANVDHLLDFAETFGLDLAGLDGNEPAKRALVAAQLFAKQPHEFAALGSRDQTPFEESRMSLFDGRGRTGGIDLPHMRHGLAGDRGFRHQRAAGIADGFDTELNQKRVDLDLERKVFDLGGWLV